MNNLTDDLKQGLEKILLDVNKNRGSAFTTMKSNIDYTTRQIKYYEENLNSYNRQLQDYQKDIKKLKDDRLHEEDIFAALEQIGRHKYVDWAYLNKSQELVIQTKPLFAYDPILEVSTDECVGRYAFKIGLYNKSFTIAALDFIAQGYRHPNLMSHPSSACWGGYDSTIRKMFNHGDYFSAVDAMILFFSTFPQQGGHRPIYWYIWLNERKNKFYQNPWVEGSKEALYVLGKPAPARPRRFKITRRNAVTIEEYGEKKEYKLKGLNFRNY
jgi:hypothetical protein